MAWNYIIFASLLYVVSAQTDAPALTITLTPEIQKYYNESGLESAKDKYMDLFKKKCEKNGHPEAFDNIQANALFFISCMGSLIDMDTLLEEIDDATPTGRVDEVFKKYCNKTPQFKKCFHDMTESIKPCFSVQEQKNFKTVYNITDQLIEFVCYKEGDRIALFVAEGGKECFQQKQDGMLNCFNEVFQLPTSDQLQNFTDIDSFFNLEFKEKQCNQMTSLQKCVVGVLETCEKPTTANIIESLFNFIRKSTPCKNVKQAGRNSPGAASGLEITLSTLSIAVLSAILL